MSMPAKWTANWFHARRITHVPEPDRLVRAGRGEGPAVRGEDQLPHPGPVAFQGLSKWLASGRVAQVDGGIHNASAEGQHAAVRRENQRGRPLLPERFAPTPAATLIKDIHSIRLRHRHRTQVW